MKTAHHKSKTKFLLFLLIISLFLFYFDKRNKNSKIVILTHDAFAPFTKHTSKIVKKIKTLTFDLFHFYALSQKNSLLEKQIDQLKEIKFELLTAKKENQRLHSLLSFCDTIKYQPITAKIIGYDFSNWYNSFIIDKGSNHQITIDQAVLSPKGVVGKIVSVSKKTAKVMLLTDRNSKVGGRIHRTRELGILVGRNKDYCILNYLPRNTEVKKGDLIVTPGFGAIFPKEFILGVVSKVYSENSEESDANEYAKDFGLYRQAKVIPSVNFSNLEEVIIINKTNKKQKK